MFREEILPHLTCNASYELTAPLRMHRKWIKITESEVVLFHIYRNKFKKKIPHKSATKWPSISTFVRCFPFAQANVRCMQDTKQKISLPCFSTRLGIAKVITNHSVLISNRIVFSRKPSSDGEQLRGADACPAKDAVPQYSFSSRHLAQ